MSRLAFRLNRLAQFAQLVAYSSTLPALVLGICLAFAEPAPAKADDVALCDALASEDAARAPVVPLNSIDADKATAACSAALAAQPTDAAIVHQYARALERAGRTEDARRLYDWAASDSYAPAVAALVRLGGKSVPDEPFWSSSDRDRLAGEMSATAGAMRRYADGLPTDPADPLAILATVGTDPDALAAWVSKHTHLMAYRGSLRGADGVLADRAGNSLDRALALAKLLTQAGRDVRLAHATLTNLEASQLLAGDLPPPESAGLAKLTREELVKLLDDPRIGADETAGVVAGIIDRRTRIDALIAERVQVLLPTLIEASAPEQDSADAAVRSEELAALSDHYWVQIRSGVDWRDLNLDAALTTMPIASDTFTPEDLPEGLRQEVVLRVVLELQDETGRHEELLLSHTVHPDEQPFQTLTLVHIGKGLDALEQMLGSADLPKKTMASLDGVTAWTPILLADRSTIVDKLFTSSGAVEPANLNAFAGIGGGLGGLFGDVGAALDGTQQEPVAAAVPVAEWLEIEVRVPGASPRVERRTIFDLLGPSARAGNGKVEITQDLARARELRLIGPTDILIAGATASQVSLARTTAETVARVADNVRAVTAMPEGARPSEAPSGARVPLTLWRFAGQRLDYGTEAALTAPNVFLMHDRFGWDGANGQTHQTEFDIVFNEVGGGSFYDRVRQGLVDTALENALVGDPSTGNVAALQATDVANGRAWRRLESGDTARLSSFSPDLQTRIAADLKAGYIVIAPQSPVDAATGWWRIDPRLGTTLGMMWTGGGAELAEEALMAYQSATSASCFVAIAATIASAIGGSVSSTGAGVGMAICGAAGVGGFAGGAAGAALAGLGSTGGLTILAVLIAHLA